MKRYKKTYSIFQLASAVFLILALLWLTVSIPFVYASQQELAKLNKADRAQSPLSCNDEENTNPFGNTTEEKAPGNGTTSISEEYLHENHTAHYLFSIALQYHKSENAGTYNAFHGEVHVPPPNVA